MKENVFVRSGLIRFCSRGQNLIIAFVIYWFLSGDFYMVQRFHCGTRRPLHRVRFLLQFCFYTEVYYTVRDQSLDFFFNRFRNQSFIHLLKKRKEIQSCYLSAK